MVKQFMLFFLFELIIPLVIEILEEIQQLEPLEIKKNKKQDSYKKKNYHLSTLDPYLEKKMALFQMGMNCTKYILKYGGCVLETNLKSNLEKCILNLLLKFLREEHCAVRILEVLLFFFFLLIFVFFGGGIKTF
jgi:hypothetical protein